MIQTQDIDYKYSLWILFYSSKIGYCYKLWGGHRGKFKYGIIFLSLIFPGSGIHMRLHLQLWFTTYKLSFITFFSLSDMGLCRIYFSNTKALSLNSLDHSQQDTQDKLSCYGNKSIRFCSYLFFALFYKVTFNSLTTFGFIQSFSAVRKTYLRKGMSWSFLTSWQTNLGMMFETGQD